MHVNNEHAHPVIVLRMISVYLMAAQNALAVSLEPSVCTELTQDVAAR